ncbi:leucyl/phenylalanyl-tRNA--protein transferase [Zwartia panacis]|uniref:leucyl/phenylalanyl-tRNA--protein transferase n=1 Tax=Zwartia panacis TaxID=2683345 RepID=UPI0025B539B2|nr:leucyl/phenylalanyl-tRNA--protein transferase [Zwartia panacis]MDN4015981.1 leucyl/phenylalanyl-tRNA--protein transferase [Zwartia panacis]
MKLTWLDTDTPFPPVSQALTDPPGLLAAGADLSVERLRAAYSRGIFPWFSQDEPPLWWSPDPRMVLKCDELHVSHSLGKRLRQISRAQASGDFSLAVTVDTAFGSVIRSCARSAINGQPGTWITEEMQLAYETWHLLGQAHSIETWINGKLAGGLYGVNLGRMFFGESMFSRANDASKIAFVHLVAFLKRRGVEWIDCQMQTNHLASLGARTVPRSEFLQHVEARVQEPDVSWQPGLLDQEGGLHPLPV